MIKIYGNLRNVAGGVLGDADQLRAKTNEDGSIVFQSDLNDSFLPKSALELEGGAKLAFYVDYDLIATEKDYFSNLYYTENVNSAKTESDYISELQSKFGFTEEVATKLAGYIINKDFDNWDSLFQANVEEAVKSKSSDSDKLENSIFQIGNDDINIKISPKDIISSTYGRVLWKSKTLTGAFVGESLEINGYKFKNLNDDLTTELIFEIDDAELNGFTITEGTVTQLDFSNYVSSDFESLTNFLPEPTTCEEISFEGLDFSNVTLSTMFTNCITLTSVYVKNCNEATRTKLLEKLTAETEDTWTNYGDYLIVADAANGFAWTGGESITYNLYG